MSDAISIVSAANAAYAPHLGAMLHSLFQKTTTRVDFYLLHQPVLPQDVVERIDSLCRRHGSTLQSVAVPPERLSYLHIPERYPIEAWYRLLLPSLLPDLDRVLWLDADLLIRHSVQELWDTDLEGHAIAAVPNAMMPHHWQHLKDIGVDSERSRYFNTGVMLLDLKRMRAEDVEARFRDTALRLQGRALFADQDILNPVLGDDYKQLPLPWNVTAGTYFNVRETLRVHGSAQFSAALRQPKIVHFTRLKPWEFKSAHPFRRQYLAHRAAAGWPPVESAGRTLHDWLPARWYPVSLRLLLGHLRRRRFSEALQIARALISAGGATPANDRYSE